MAKCSTARELFADQGDLTKPYFVYGKEDQWRKETRRLGVLPFFKQGLMYIIAHKQIVSVEDKYENRIQLTVTGKAGKGGRGEYYTKVQIKAPDKNPIDLLELQGMWRASRKKDGVLTLTKQRIPH